MPDACSQSSKHCQYESFLKRNIRAPWRGVCNHFWAILHSDLHSLQHTLVCFSDSWRLACTSAFLPGLSKIHHPVGFWKPYRVWSGIFAKTGASSCPGAWKCCFLFLQVKMIGMEPGPPSRPRRLGQWRGPTESTHTDAIKAFMRGKYHFWANSCFWFLYLPGFLLL